MDIIWIHLLITRRKKKEKKKRTDGIMWKGENMEISSSLSVGLGVDTLSNN